MPRSFSLPHGVPVHTRIWLVLLFVLAAPRFFAQCCCSNIVLEITLDNVAGLRSDRDFEVKETRGQYTFSSVDKDSTDRRLSLMLDAGCGLMERRLFIMRRATGERMELSVLVVGFDGWHPGLRVPFRPGTYDLDLERMIACAGLDRGWDRSEAPVVPSSAVVPCGAGLLRVERDAEGAMLEPLDLWTHAFRPGQVACDAPGFACFPEGPATLSQRTVQAADQRSGGSVRAARVVSGIGHVNAEGSSNVRMDTEQTDRIYRVEMAMMGTHGWRAAWLPDASAPDGRRAIPSMMRFTLDLSR